MNRSREIFEAQLDAIRRRTDAMFARLMAFQWAFGVVIALLVSPQAWSGVDSRIHVHVWAALILGGLIASLPIVLCVARPGRRLTRRVVAVGQILFSALLIHLTGGRIETHFHVFGSLAFLAFYRDSSVLVCAAAVVILDHTLRGLFWPQSVYGVLQIQPWRFLEHVGWVLFENLFLIQAVRQGLSEMREIAERQAELESTNQRIESAIEARTRELRAAHDTIAQSEREKLSYQFLANISHDLRTPIASIRGYAETLRRGALEDTKNRVEFVKTIEKNAERIGSLVENLLDLVKLDGDTIAPHRAVVGLRQCSCELAKDLAPLTRRKQTTIELEMPGELAVLADPDQLWRILQNLLSNAVKFTPAGQPITVRAWAEDERVVISVLDRGPGIPPEELPLIFERFHSRHRGGATGVGIGLGLAIAKNLVELNGGQLWARSAEGRGAEFSFSLPLARCELPLAGA